MAQEHILHGKEQVNLKFNKKLSKLKLFFKKRKIKEQSDQNMW